MWPWLVQLGKQRAGWYLPRGIERLVAPRRRATRRVLAHWQTLAVGDVIPDYGGPRETFTVAGIDAPYSVVYFSRRKHTELTWSITLQLLATRPGVSQTRVFLRLRMAPIKHKWLAGTLGEFFDLLTIAGMAAGLRERLTEQNRDQ